MTTPSAWGSVGSHLSQSLLGTKFPTWAFNGTCSHTWSISLIKKRVKYLEAILDWETRCTHNLLDTQKLYGRLLHVTLVIPAGRAYFTILEALLSTFNCSPFVPHSSPGKTPQMTFDGGSTGSVPQTSQWQSQNPNPLLTTVPTQMLPAWDLVWPSQSASNRGHGSSSQGGNPRGETSSVLRLLAMSCWSLASVPCLTTANTSWSMGTTGELLRDGGRD